MKYLFIIIFYVAVTLLYGTTKSYMPIIITGTSGNLYFNDTDTIDAKSFNETFFVSAAFKFRYTELLTRCDLQLINRFNTYTDINYLRKVNPGWYLRAKWNIGNFSMFANINPVFLATDNTFRISGSSGFFYRINQLKVGLSGTTKFYEYSGNFQQSFQATGIFKQKKPIALEHQCSLTVLLKDTDVNDGRPIYFHNLKYSYQLKINLRQFKVTDSSLPLEDGVWEDDDYED
ncbi:MAG: hypothetical protein II196_06225 [Spirochaetales bacterium]|nr:hypothetical protein [Spirochaetales bacterium]